MHIHVGKNVRVKLEKKFIISCNFGTLLFYTLISIKQYSNTTLRYMFAQGRKNECRPLLCHFAAGDKQGIQVEYIHLFKPEITEFKCMGGRH